MSDAHELIQKSHELIQNGELAEAERLVLRAVDIFRKSRDPYALSHAYYLLGSVHERANNIDSAIEAYFASISIEAGDSSPEAGQASPATFQALVSLLLLSERVDEAFEVLKKWGDVGYYRADQTPLFELISISRRIEKDGKSSHAIHVLEKAIEVAKQQHDSQIVWVFRGLIGHLTERTGNEEQARKIYTQAIYDGSMDQLTFKRLIMLLEKSKEYSEASAVISKAKMIPGDAAWHTDILNREQRVLGKLVGRKKGDSDSVVPDFVIRSGKTALTLQKQVKFRPEPRALRFGNGTFIGLSGGKSPKLYSVRIEDETRMWEASVILGDHELYLTRDSILVVATSGRIGDGTTSLQFFSFNGEEITMHTFDDVRSAVAIIDAFVYVGSRSGTLHAFSTDGSKLWEFQVPGSHESTDDPYSRPSPYFISANPSLVACSSYNNLYILSSSGSLLTHWSTQEQVSNTRGEDYSITFIHSPASIRAIQVHPNQDVVFAATDDAVYQVQRSKSSAILKPNVGVVHNLAIGPNDETVVVGSTATQVFESGRVLKRLKIENAIDVRVFPQARTTLLVSNRNLHMFDAEWKLVTEIEFTKSIKDVGVSDDGSVAVTTRYGIIFTRNQPMHRSDTPRSPSSNTAEMPQTVRQSEESGIPIVWIPGAKVDSRTSKAQYKLDSGKLAFIEELALRHFQSGGYDGVISENTFWWMMMTLVFWDVIFHKIPGVFEPRIGEFPSRFQDMPLDFFSSDFYQRRRVLIEKRTRELVVGGFMGLGKKEITAEIADAYKSHYGKPCRPIENWDAYSLSQLQVAATHLGAEKALKLLNRLMSDFSHLRSGMPDLFLFASGKRPKFVEVKSEHEKVAEHQIRWLQFLQNDLGIDVAICRVVDAVSE